MKMWLAVFLAWTVVALPHPVFADRENLMPLRVAVEVSRPPFSFRDPSGTLTGFDVAIAQAVCREMGRPCLFSALPLPQALSTLKRGGLDLIVAGVGRTPELAASVDFSERYYRAHAAFIALAGELPDPADKGTPMRVGTLTNSAQHAYLLTHSERFASIRTTATLTTLWQMLRLGTVDAVLTDNLLGYAFLLSPDGADFEIIGSPLSFAELPGDGHIVLPKGQNTLREALNRALQTLRRNGEYLALSYRYFSIDID